LQLSEFVPSKWVATAKNVSRFLDAYPVVVVCPSNERRMFCHNKRVLTFADILPEVLSTRNLVAKPRSLSPADIFREILEAINPSGTVDNQRQGYDAILSAANVLGKFVLILDDFDLVFEACLDQKQLTAGFMSIMSRGFPKLVLVLIMDEDALQSIKQTYTASFRRFKEIRPEMLVLSPPEKYELLRKLYQKISDSEAESFVEDNGEKSLYEFTFEAYCRFGL